MIWGKKIRECNVRIKKKSELHTTYLVYYFLKSIAMKNFKVSAIYPFSGYVPKTDFCDNESTFLNKSAVTSPTDSSRDKLLAPKLRSKHSQSSEVKNHKGF